VLYLQSPLKKGFTPNLIREGCREGNRRCPFVVGPPGFEPESPAILTEGQEGFGKGNPGAPSFPKPVG